MSINYKKKIKWIEALHFPILFIKTICYVFVLYIIGRDVSVILALLLAHIVLNLEFNNRFIHIQSNMLIETIALFLKTILIHEKKVN